MCRACCCEDVGDKALVVALQREVHLPAVVGAPMPIDHVLSSTGVPVEFHGLPKFVDLVDHVGFCLDVGLHILAYAKQRLHQEARLHEVTAIVLCAEGDGLARRSVHPVRPHAMITVGLRQIIDDAGQSCHAFFTLDPAAIHADNQAGNTEARTSCGDCHLVVRWIDAIEVNTLVGQSRSRVGAFPHVVQALSLHKVEQFVGTQFDGLAFPLTRLLMRSAARASNQSQACQSYQ